MNRLTPTLFFALLLLTAACETDNYETGDGRYSYLRAEFVEAHTIQAKSVDRVVLDDDTRIAFNTPHATAWAEKADTTYRAVLYFNDKPDGPEPISLQPVYVLRPIDKKELKQTPTDPVTLVGTWTATNGRYLNIIINVKTGATDDDALQNIALMTETTDDGQQTITFLHAQNDVPQYYSSRVLISIPTEKLSNNVKLRINTYDGWKESAFQLR